MAEDIKREMTAILRELKDPRIDSMLTIVRTDLSGDMSNCKIYVSSFAGIEKAKESVKGLKVRPDLSAESFFTGLKCGNRLNLPSSLIILSKEALRSAKS